MGIGALRRHYPARDIEAEPPFPDGDPADTWKVDQLKAYAAEHQVDLTRATKKAEVLAAIAAARPPVPFDPGQHSPDEVVAYLASLDDTDTEARDAEVLRVVELERTGQNRADLLEAIGAAPPA